MALLSGRGLKGAGELGSGEEDDETEEGTGNWKWMVTPSLAQNLCAQRNKLKVQIIWFKYVLDNWNVQIPDGGFCEFWGQNAHFSEKAHDWLVR